MPKTLAMINDVLYEHRRRYLEVRSPSLCLTTVFKQTYQPKLSSSQHDKQMVLSDEGLKMTLGLEGKGLRSPRNLKYGKVTPPPEARRYSKNVAAELRDGRETQIFGSLGVHGYLFSSILTFFFVRSGSYFLSHGIRHAPMMPKSGRAFVNCRSFKLAREPSERLARGRADPGGHCRRLIGCATTHPLHYRKKVQVICKLFANYLQIINVQL